MDESHEQVDQPVEPAEDSQPESAEDSQPETAEASDDPDDAA